MKRFLWILLLFLNINIFAQNSRWIDYYSYLKINQIFNNSENIFGVSENTFFTYNIQNQEIERFSSVNGLSGDDISKMIYNNNLKKFFIIHKNGLIEIIDEQKNIQKIPDLLINNFINEDKKICQNIEINNNTLYLSMGYGISVFDLDNNEFNDTYYIGNGGTQIKVYAIKIFGNQIYAATEEGLKIAELNNNLINFNNWTTIRNGIWNFLTVFNNKLIAGNGSEIYEVNGTNFSLKLTTTHLIRNISASDQNLTVIERNKIIILNNNYVTVQTIDSNNFNNYNFICAKEVNNNFYVGTENHGIQKTDINFSNTAQINPDCPLYNTPFGLDVKDKQLWVVFGKHDPIFNPNPLVSKGVSHFNGSAWNNIPYGQIQAKSLCYVQINPSNLNEVYISSGHNGLVKIVNENQISIFNETNSPLQTYVDANNHTTRVFGIKYDDENNLWVTQWFGTNNNKIKVLKNDGNWNVIPIQGKTIHAVRSIDFDKDQNTWFGDIHQGIVGINKQTGNYVTFKTGIKPVSYPNVKALAIDKNDIMWIGNHNGIFIFSHPEKLFENTANETFQQIKIEYEGTVQLLLQGQQITTIRVDSSNNKWIGTSGSGVYYVSDDGKKTIYHFTHQNSPLPSNEIYDIAIDGKTGLVYFATGKGLLGFKGNATESAENLDDVYAFPNPVNMKKHNFVTIRGLIEGVNIKIVDVEGNLVYETTSKGGSIDWDLTAFGRYKVASGVYIALITDEDGEKTQTTKILVIR